MRAPIWLNRRREGGIRQRRRWTLLHTFAANPLFTACRQLESCVSSEDFFIALGRLLTRARPPPAAYANEWRRTPSTPQRWRAALSLWVCRAHKLSAPASKEAFYCDMGVLDARWKDCGCNSTRLLR